MRISKDPEERKNEIISASRRLFEKQGIKRTKVSEIVKSIGVAQGLFYYYFKSKDEVISAVIEQNLMEIESSINEVIADNSIGFGEKIVRCVDMYAGILMEFTRGSEKGVHDGLDIHISAKAEEKMLGQLHRLARSGIASGALRLRYPEETISMIFHGLKQMGAFSGLLDREKLFILLEQGLHLPDGALSSVRS